MAVTRSEQAIVQAIRSVCDCVGVGSLKQKQTEAIVLHQDTFICASHAEDYCLQYCEYGYYSPLLFLCRQWLAQAMAAVDISLGSMRVTPASGAALVLMRVLIVFYTHAHIPVAVPGLLDSPDPFPRFSSTH